MTAGAGSSSFAAASTAMPSPSGIWMSRITRSGRKSRIAAIACATPPACPATATCSTDSSSSARRSRTIAESSTMRTCTTRSMRRRHTPRYAKPAHPDVGVCPTGTSGGQLVLQGVADQLRAGGEPQLLENAGAVGADGLGREVELRRDLAHGLAGADQAQHLVLAVGEGLVRDGRAAGVERRGELLGEGGGHVCAAAHDLPDRLDQVLRR